MFSCKNTIAIANKAYPLSWSDVESKPGIYQASGNSHVRLINIDNKYVLYVGATNVGVATGWSNHKFRRTDEKMSINISPN